MQQKSMFLKILNIISQLKKLITLKLVILLIQLKNEILKNKITTDHDLAKYIATQEFNKLTLNNFAARFSQANFVEKICFWY